MLTTMDAQPAAAATGDRQAHGQMSEMHSKGLLLSQEELEVLSHLPPPPSAVGDLRETHDAGVSADAATAGSTQESTGGRLAAATNAHMSVEASAAHPQNAKHPQRPRRIISFIVGTAATLASSILGVVDMDDDDDNEHNHRSSVRSRRTSRHGSADAALESFPPMSTTISSPTDGAAHASAAAPEQELPSPRLAKEKRRRSWFAGGGRRESAARGSHETSPVVSQTSLVAEPEPQTAASPKQTQSDPHEPSSLRSFIWDFLVGGSAPPSADVAAAHAGGLSDADQTAAGFSSPESALASLPPSSPIEQALALRADIKIRGRNEAGEAAAILTIEISRQLQAYLPLLLREAYALDLLYSIEQHGISLNTLYDRCREAGPCLIAIRDENENVFGAFASESIEIHSGFYGNGECFLWKQNADGSIVGFPSTGNNQYLILSEPQCIAFGGGEGHFGLWFDDELLHGHSGPCQTFANERLSRTSEFRIVALEVWAFRI